MACKESPSGDWQLNLIEHEMLCSDANVASNNIPLLSESASASIPILNGISSGNQMQQTKSSLAAEVAASSYGSSSSIFRTSPSSTPMRPTREEVTALWEIMPTSSLINSPLPEPDSSSHIETRLKKSKQVCPLVSPIGSPPNESLSMFSIPKIKNGPPYENTVDITASTPIDVDVPSNVKAYTLTPRPCAFKFSSATSSHEDARSNCIHYGLGPHLGILPESVIYTIFGFIDYTERHPTLMLVSQGMTSILTRPEFLLEMRHAHKVVGSAKSLLSQAFEDEAPASNEVLLIVGGKCPVKDQTVHRRMIMQSNNYKGIMGYDLKRAKWLRFGGDPMEPFKRKAESEPLRHFNSHIPRNNLHPLSPMNIIDSKPIYIEHPLYSVIFFGGTHYETGQPSNRVIAFSFLTAKWELWPDMMRPRHGDDIILARVESKNAVSDSEENPQPNDSIVLIGCEIEFCDCYRCNPPATADERNEDVDMGFIIDDIDSDAPPGCRSPGERRESKTNAAGRCEVLDLVTRKWTKRKSKAPSCPPDDGGVAVLKGRWVFLPGTCPPPPSAASWLQTTTVQFGEDSVVTPSRPDTSSKDIHHMDVEDSASSSGDEILESSLGDLFRSLHYRPGLVYDSWLDEWETLAPRPYITTSSPMTFAYRDRVLVLGGYRSSSENALSCYRHREEDAILDYEDHLDYAWWYTPNMGWTFGGGNSTMGHRQDFASSSDMAAAVRASMDMLSSSCPARCLDSTHNSSIYNSGFPFGAPVNVRGGTICTYQCRMTLLGGLSTFSRTFYDTERKFIWQFYPETCEWKQASLELPVPALLDGYSFSLHV